jgi:hypothetical protein
MKRFGSKTVSKRAHFCPECNKQRLHLLAGEEPDRSTKEFDLPNGEVVELYVQVCPFCIQKYYKKYWEPKKLDARKILKALEEGQELPENASLEELL